MKTNHNKTIKRPSYLLLLLIVTLAAMLVHQLVTAQSCAPNIADFTSVNPNSRGETLQLPPSHTFQKIFKSGDEFSNGTTPFFNVDFAGYVPINNSNTKGYLSINNEWIPGGVAILDIEFNKNNDKLWSVSNMVNIDFSAVGGTNRNCSGAVTPWGTIISSEEIVNNCNENRDTYQQSGWQVEVDPASKTVVGKHYAMGNFAHENAAILQQENRTVAYQGADQNDGYLFKFVSFQKNDLSNGDLYVYKGPKGLGTGSWVKIDNQTIEDRNCTIQLALEKQATVFNGVEDVEIGIDGLIYFAVKNENRVYYLEDTNPLGAGQVNFKGTYVGGRNYEITLSDNSRVNEAWGVGNDNLAFDNEGNLWVFQDGGKHHIWLVKNGHTPSNPQVEIFATTPNGSEPTGITFSPDNRFMFISIQHPNYTNQQTLADATGNVVVFNEGITLVIARNEHLGYNNTLLGCTNRAACNFNALATVPDCSCIFMGNVCTDNNPETINDTYNDSCNCVGEKACKTDVLIKANAAPNNTPLQNLYESSKSISTEVSTSNSVDVIINKNETVNLKSDYIKLNEGFKVENGGCLNAEIEPCK